MPPARLRSLPVRPLPGGLALYEAASAWARLWGLVGLRELPAGCALRLPRTRSVHTLGMRFAIDLVWCDADGAVVRVDEQVRPGRLRACRPARSVVETAAGEGARFAAAMPAVA